MKATCPHVVGVDGFGPAADGCETCLEVGGTWVHLRQCLACGRTGCCDSSPNRHASAHAGATGHQVVRALEPGEDWSWCYACERTLRLAADGTWREVDTFFEAGLWYAQQRAADGGPIDAGSDETTDDGFPIGLWAATYRARRNEGAIDPEQAAALETIPGWRW